MTLWEFRQWMEQGIPVWALIAAYAVVVVGVLLYNIIRWKRGAK